MVEAHESLDYEYALDHDCTTLSRHVFQQLQSFSADAQDLSALMSRIALAGKLIARRLSRAGLMEGALGFTGGENVQGESVKKMDVYANEVFISVFKQSGLVCRLASEEMEKPYYIPENCPLGRYTLLYDPIDGSPMSISTLMLAPSLPFASRKEKTSTVQQVTCCRMDASYLQPATFFMVPAQC
jgi:fructose-1,6-bisphosphatase I